MFVVKTLAYCGMVTPHGTYDTRAEAEDRVTKRLRYLVNEGCDYTKIDDDEWEIHEPEDCVLVPDFCGYLTITFVPEESHDEQDDFDGGPDF